MLADGHQQPPPQPLERDGDDVLIRVDDDGPGIESHRHAQVLQRGGRLDQRVPGHGLGLAIVGDTVEAYGGTLDLQRSPLGGLRVSVRLPRPASDPRPGR